ncbi:hypothetical protein [Urbifossiella limnaea]|uniref:DUF4190 domain-containing protein n=1 Tax=Urbifossiella limnaea TaxID=2528023 RepID=A0A517XLY5_9BACT|nr:hypothetical protein [Urbifossiella limnaea]QDU18523.1 hypothetical protein ETAA1_04130 [Urbifossiella limnaea]
MPQLPVTCPRCDADLTVGRELLNRPVECGACGRAFVPVMDPGGREPDDEPPRPKRGGTPLFGVLSLILGLLGIITCCLGPLSLVMSAGAVVSGLIGLRTRDGRALAIAGLVAGGLMVMLRVLGLAVGWRGAFDLW